MYALGKGRCEKVAIQLIDAGARTAIQDRWGVTALLYALYYEQDELPFN